MVLVRRVVTDGGRGACSVPHPFLAPPLGMVYWCVRRISTASPTFSFQKLLSLQSMLRVESECCAGCPECAYLQYDGNTKVTSLGNQHTLYHSNLHFQSYHHTHINVQQSEDRIEYTNKNMYAMLSRPMITRIGYSKSHLPKPKGMTPLIHHSNNFKLAIHVSHPCSRAF